MFSSALLFPEYNPLPFSIRLTNMKREQARKWILVPKGIVTRIILAYIKEPGFLKAETSFINKYLLYIVSGYNIMKRWKG